MQFEVRKRSEADLAGRWGIFDLHREFWVDVHFATISEAETAVAMLVNVKPSSRRGKPLY